VFQIQVITVNNKSKHFDAQKLFITSFLFFLSSFVKKNFFAIYHNQE